MGGFVSQNACYRQFSCSSCCVCLIFSFLAYFYYFDFFLSFLKLFFFVIVFTVLD